MTTPSESLFGDLRRALELATHANHRDYSPVDIEQAAAKALDGLSDLYLLMGSLLSFTIAAPSNNAGERARESAIRRAKAALGLPPPEDKFRPYTPFTPIPSGRKQSP